MTDTEAGGNPLWKGYDDGLNKGLIARAGGAPPAFYAEGNILIAYAKAMALALVAIAPYYAVLDQLGSISEDSFVPCNNVTCHYMRLFDSTYIPGSGSDIMGVTNGVSRPIAMRYRDFAAYACPANTTAEAASFGDKVFARACPHMDNQEELDKLGKDDAEVQKAMDEETEAGRNMTMSVRLAFFVTKIPLVLFTFPATLMAKANAHWGMDRIPSASCPGLSKTEMQAKCADPKTRKGVHNHLHTWGPARDGTLISLVLWGLSMGIHDCMLLKDVSEKTTLIVGSVSTFFCGCAVASVFCWAMGATEVFVAEVEGFRSDQCMCFYQLSEIAALAGLATPFALLAGFAIKVQLQGMATLFGDTTYYQPYIVPHYLAKQSYMWTWALLTTPKAAGTVQANPREKFETADWFKLFHHMQALQFFRYLVIYGFVALSASPFMIALKELLTGILMGGKQTASVNFVILYIVMPLPSIIAWGAGLLTIMELYYTCIQPDEGETFADNIDSACPDWLFGERQSTWLKSKPTLEKNFAYVFFAIATVVSLVWTAAVSQGLCPDLNVLLGIEDVTKPSLAQAELWGACGFIFVGFHIQKGISFVFSTWDDVESLKNLGHGGLTKKERRKGARRDEGHEASHEPLIELPSKA